MTKRLFASTITAAALAAAASTAGAAGPPLAISASPFSLKLQGAATGSIHVVNPGSKAVTVDVSTGDLAVAQTGKVTVDPKEKPPLSARAWLTVAPGKLTLAPGAGADVTVNVHPPRDATPGDHYALVLLTTVPPNNVQIGVRTQIGVSVVDTIAGAVPKPVRIEAASVVTVGKKHALQLRVVNPSAFLEHLVRGAVTADIRRGARRVAHLVAAPRVLLPRSTAQIELPYPAKLRGRFSVTTEVKGARRTFMLSL
jgi:P pilus assembly chaperone PapD